MFRRFVAAGAILAGVAVATPATLAFAHSQATVRTANAHEVVFSKPGHEIDYSRLPWCKAPEVSQAIELPLAGLMVIGGFAFAARRRQDLQSPI